MTNKKAMEIYNEVIKNNEVKEEKVTRHIVTKTAIFEGWQYTFYFYNNKLKKIEAFNHRELIEQLVED